MPTFEGLEISVSVDIDFEVFCKSCGIGLCNISSTRKSRNRNYAQVEVDPCPNCMQDLKNEIQDLKSQLESLMGEIESHKK